MMQSDAMWDGATARCGSAARKQTNSLARAAVCLFALGSALPLCALPSRGEREIGGEKVGLRSAEPRNGASGSFDNEDPKVCWLVRTCFRTAQQSLRRAALVSRWLNGVSTVHWTSLPKLRCCKKSKRVRRQSRTSPRNTVSSRVRSQHT